MLIGALERIAEELGPDWVLVRSGQGYPVRPLVEVESRLAAGARRRVPQLGLGAPHGADPGPARGRLLPPLRPRLGIRSPRLPFGPARRCWVSSDWPTLGRRALGAVLRAAREERALMRYYRLTIVPSESSFATALMNDPGLQAAHDDRRFFSFTPGSPSPEVLTEADLDRVRASGAEFARKFDPAVAGAVLDRLDELRRSAGGR